MENIWTLRLFAFFQFCWVEKATFKNIVLLDKTTCTLAGVRFCDWSGGLAISLKITIRYIISYLKVFTMNSISNKSFVARSFIFIPFEDSTRCHRFSHQSHRQVERSQCTAQDRHLGSKWERWRENIWPIISQHKNTKFVFLMHRPFIAICCSTKTKVCADERKNTKKEIKVFVFFGCENYPLHIHRRMLLWWNW